MLALAGKCKKINSVGFSWKVQEVKINSAGKCKKLQPCVYTWLIILSVCVTRLIAMLSVDKRNLKFTVLPLKCV